MWHHFLPKMGEHSLLQKFLFTYRWLEFIYIMSDWNYWYFHQISHDQDSRLDMKVTTVKTSRISLYSIWSSYVHIPVSETLADGDKELGRGNMGVLKVPDFYGAIIGKKNFFHFKKYTYDLCKPDVSIPVPKFNTLWKKTCSVVSSCKLQTFSIC